MNEKKLLFILHFADWSNQGISYPIGAMKQQEQGGDITPLRLKAEYTMKDVLKNGKM